MSTVSKGHMSFVSADRSAEQIEATDNNNNNGGGEEVKDWYTEIMKHCLDGACGKVLSSNRENEPKKAKYQFDIRDNIKYCFYPTVVNSSGRVLGLMQIDSNVAKPKCKASFPIRYTVIKGEVEFLVKKEVLIFRQGSIITLPKDIKYSLRNVSNQNCFLEFETYEA